MDSTVRARPNHYEMLGLTPGASGEDIERAFAREIGKPRAFGGIALVGVAYETLRDAARRRAYDEMLGLGRKSEPKPEPEQRHVASYRLRPVETRVSPLPRSPGERRTAAFIAASLRAPAHPEPHLDPVPAPASPAERLMESEPLPKPEPLPPILRGQDDSAAPDADDRGIDWRRTAMAVGALVAAVATIGAWAGWEAGNDLDPEQPPERAVTAALPPAKPVAATATASSPGPAPSLAEARRERPRRGAIAVARTARPALAPPSTAPEERLADIAAGLQDAPRGVASETAGAEVAPVAAVAASMPLPNAVIARTIGRIGYACGRVASTAPVEGEASGVFDVTCTSGHTYRAAPVRGRYHFRRVGNQ